jgi:urea transport system permease protein
MSKAPSLAAPASVPVSTAAGPALPPARRLSPLGWLGILVFMACFFLPAYFYHNDRYWLPLFSRYMALALFAVSVDLVWGYTGLLSLGQGLYFGLGVYMVGYSLKLQEAATAADMPFEVVPDMALPNFMEYCRLPAVPSYIAPLIYINLAFALAIVLPSIVAALFGLVTFWRRIKGVYFSLITQALVLAVFTFVVNQQPYTGGVVGMTNLPRLLLFGILFEKVTLFYLIAGSLAVCFLLSVLLVRSKFGRVLTAIRDNEYRVLALGYNTAMYKTFIFALAGGMAGLAGGLYVSALRTCGPDVYLPSFSIEIVIMVAVGGRGTLAGAVMGVVLVNYAKTYLTGVPVVQPYWPIIMGSLFVVVVLLLPDGILGLFRKMSARAMKLYAGATPVAETSLAAAGPEITRTRELPSFAPAGGLPITARIKAASQGNGTGMPFPIAKVCPHCGSNEYTTRRARTFVAFVSDRVCKSCNTRYTPPTPVWAAFVFILLGLPIAAIAAFSVLISLGSGELIRFPTMIVEAFFSLMGLLAVAHGIRALIRQRNV